MFESKLISFSDDGSLLAICNANGILKIWNTASNILENEFHPGENFSTSVTCLRFSPKVKIKSLNNKKKKSDTVADPLQTLVALGTLDGAILLYSLSKQSITEKLIHSEGSPVSDISWHSPQTVVSVGDNKKLILWNINNEKLFVTDVVATKSICSLGNNNYVSGGTDIQFVTYCPKTKTTKTHVTSAHKTNITQLVPVSSRSEVSARYFLTAAENDRFVYAWSSSSELKKPVGIFMVKDIVRTVSCYEMEEMSFGIAVTTKKGYLRFYVHHFNGKQAAAPLPYKGTLKLLTKTKKSYQLTIINAQFLSPTELLISYGSDLFPHCERVSIKELEGEVEWGRKDPSLFMKSKSDSLQKTLSPHVPEDAVHLMPTQMTPFEMKEVNSKRKRGGETANLPMEERLGALSLSQPLPGVPDGRPLDNYVHLLIQALHSKDTTLMNSILSKGEDEEIINNTVRRLPVANVVPFVEYLQNVVNGKGLKNLCCINWIKSVLYHHMSHLSTVSNKEQLLEPFYAIFAARTSSLLAVAKLHARISLLLTHVKNRHENVTQNRTDLHSEALLRLKEDSSDEEDLREMEGGGGPSESEDIWDDWTEEEEEEEDEAEDDEEDDEDEGAEDPGASLDRGAKRKLESEEFISLSEDDDVMEDEDGDDVQSVSDSD